MTTYYVRKTGNDGSAGTSPATAWLTIGKALGAAGISSGDTVYIGAGVYREKVTCNLISPVAETFVIGDVDGSHTGDAGEIRITNYLTDDKTAPTYQDLIDLNGRSYLTIQNITFVGWAVTPTLADNFGILGNGSQYISISNCFFNMGSTGNWGATAIYSRMPADTPMHWIVERCIFFVIGYSEAIDVGTDAVNTINFNIDVIVENCLILSSLGIFFGLGGNIPLAPAPGGFIVRNSTIWSPSGPCVNFSGFCNDNTPVNYIVNNILITDGGTNMVVSSDQSAIQVVDDYNLVIGVPELVYNNVVPGEHTITDVSKALLIHVGQELQQGLSLRPFGMPTADSPLLGFGDDGNAPSVDILNRPRPAGGQSILKAVGAYERHDTAVKEETVFDVTPGIKIVGPGDHEFQIPVDAMATTISVKARYDANHAATNKPQAVLLVAPEIGVSAETKTMTAAVDTWETLTFAQFTPTAKGVVTVRLVSRSAAGNGIAYFDTFNVS